MIGREHHAGDDPASFERSFAERLDSLCPFEVREAEHRDVLRPGLALVAVRRTEELLRVADAYALHLLTIMHP